MAILASGSGSNADSIMFWAKDQTDLEVVCVVSDKKKAFVLERALACNVKSQYVQKNKSLSKEEYDLKLCQTLESFSVDFVILAGFMRILSKTFLDYFPNKVINIHPSLLPKYPGKSAYEKSYASNDEEYGCTIHFVEEGMDTGKIIRQEKLLRNREDSFLEFKKKGLELENKLYPIVIGEVVRDLKKKGML